MENENNPTESLYSTTKLVVCSPSYAIGNLAGVFVSLAKERRLRPRRLEPMGLTWGYAGGTNFFAAELGFLAKATSAAVIDKVVVPWLCLSLIVDGVLSREPFAVMRRGYRDARPRLG